MVREQAEVHRKRPEAFTVFNGEAGGEMSEMVAVLGLTMV
jgi:hypothetical protein